MSKEIKYIPEVWYKGNIVGNYFKFKEEKDGVYYWSESIEGGFYNETVSVNYIFNSLKEASLEEIKPFLPKQHPDKILKKEQTNYDYLVDIFKNLKLIE